ncbi:MAG TPA: hypothetical protein VGO87_00050, partial [Acidimicrobiia bacterium]
LRRGRRWLGRGDGGGLVGAATPATGGTGDDQYSYEGRAQANSDDDIGCVPGSLSARHSGGRREGQLQRCYEKLFVTRWADLAVALKELGMAIG